MTTAITHANIALIKYWGKRDDKLFLPTKNSLSIALDALTTTTTVTLIDASQDQVFINKFPANEKITNNISAFLHFFRQQFNIRHRFLIKTENNFPTGAGLASSASGFAALALGVAHACNLDLDAQQLSIIARHGSGSACRSLFGGFVIWHQGTRPDGHDSCAEQFLPASHWPEVRVLVVITSPQEKATSSRVGMAQTVTTSPQYEQWLKDSDRRFNLIKQALIARDFTIVGHLAEADCLGMHATMHTSNPPLNYWSDTTIDIMRTVSELRTDLGIECYFTIDAGPNVKILCLAKDVDAIKKHLHTVAGIHQILESSIAHDPKVVE